MKVEVCVPPTIFLSPHLAVFLRGGMNRMLIKTISCRNFIDHTDMVKVKNYVIYNRKKLSSALTIEKFPI